MPWPFAVGVLQSALVLPRPMEEIAYWIAMSRVPQVGSARLRQLRHHFGSIEAAWTASARELRASGIDGHAVEQICQSRTEYAVYEELPRLREFGIKAYTEDDPGYPYLLRQIPDCPPVLYARGILPADEALTIAVVGTRRASPYGQQATREIVEELVAADAIVVSGMARGIDTAAHKATLDAGGVTVGVLASGLDVVYPAENATLARRVLERGALVSEYPPGVRMRRENFLLRNRIMSGMSRGVVVVEAGERSGAIRTAADALEQNRDVFAVPGSIYSPSSMGTNGLIQKGAAHAIMSAQDVLDELGVVSSHETAQPDIALQPDSVQTRLVAQMGANPVHSDDLARQLGLPSQEVAAALTLLELNDVVRSVGNMQFILSPRWRTNQT